MLIVDYLHHWSFRGLIGIQAAIVVLDGFYNDVDAFPAIRARPPINDVPDHVQAANAA